jgi:hypothetical protein
MREPLRELGLWLLLCVLTGVALCAFVLVVYLWSLL